MKIALLIPSLELGGAERNIVLLGDLLLESGIDVEVWLTSSDCREIVTKLPVVAIGDDDAKLGRGYSILRRMRWIVSNVGRYHPDCLISFLESSSIPAILAGIVSRTPTIVSIRGNPKRFIWFYRIMALLFYRIARRVVLPSREVAEYLATHYLLRNTACIPNMLTLSAAQSSSPCDKQTGPIVAVGRLVRGKRFDDVLRLAKHDPLGREVIIIGDGPEREMLESMATRDSIPATFTGMLPRREVLQCIDKAGVLVSMSVSECWPNVIAEALGMGTPVIARDCDYGPREMITDGVNGFLIHAPEDVATRREISAAFSSSREYCELARSAKASAQAWDRDNIRSQWLDIIRSATQ